MPPQKRRVRRDSDASGSGGSTDGTRSVPRDSAAELGTPSTQASRRRLPVLERDRGSDDGDSSDDDGQVRVALAHRRHGGGAHAAPPPPPKRARVARARSVASSASHGSNSSSSSSSTPASVRSRAAASPHGVRARPRGNSSVSDSSSVSGGSEDSYDSEASGVTLSSSDDDDDGDGHHQVGTVPAGGGGSGDDGDDGGDGGDDGVHGNGGDQDEEAAAVAAAVAALEQLSGMPDGSENRLTDAQIRDMLSVLLARWTSATDAETTNELASGMARMRIADGAHLSLDDLDNTTRREFWAVLRLQYAFTRRGLLEAPRSSADGAFAANTAGRQQQEASGSGYAQAFARVYEAIACTRDLLRASIVLRRTRQPAMDAAPALPDPYSYAPLDRSKLDKLPTVLMFLLRELHGKGYLRYAGACYKQIMVTVDALDEDGAVVRREYATHAWQRACSIDEFIVRNVQKEYYATLWVTLVNNGALAQLSKWLAVCHEAEFFELTPDRHYIAFNNGLLYTTEGQFFAWGSPHIPPAVVACKYFDAPFDTAWLDCDWYNIPTPAVQTILEFQVGHLDDRAAVMKWLYVLMGRLLFEVGELDKWQIMLMIVGKAGTGKSSVLDAVAQFFLPEDVEMLSNKGRTGVGDLQTVVDKLMWMCVEVKSDFGLDQAQFQSMVTGEAMCITRLYHVNRTVVWRVPGIMSGNDVPGWMDNSGSISRRMLMLFCDRRVPPSAVNPMLKDMIRAQMPAFLYKCCVAYLGAVAQFGGASIWGKYTDPAGKSQNILPMYFHTNKQRLRSLTHPLASFLGNDPRIVLMPCAEAGQGIGMPWDVFQQLAKEYVAAKNLQAIRWQPQNYVTTLEDNDIVEVALEAPLTYRGQVYTRGTKWLYGVTEVDALDEQRGAALGLASAARSGAAAAFNYNSLPPSELNTITAASLAAAAAADTFVLDPVAGDADSAETIAAMTASRGVQLAAEAAARRKRRRTDSADLEAAAAAAAPPHKQARMAAPATATAPPPPRRRSRVVRDEDEY